MIDDELDLVDDEEDNIEHTYLTFQVGEEQYAVPVAYVTEIVRLQRSFAIPDVPSFIRGVINLRGKVIPLLDVRARFGLHETDLNELTVVVVLEVGDTSTGLIVDAVSEVVEIPPASVEPRPAWRGGGGARGAMIRGIAKREDSVSFLLDVDALLDVHPARPSALTEPSTTAA